MSIQLKLSETKTYTMRELNQRTARIMDEINDSGAPAAITKHGRFIALITPLRDAAIETMVLAHGKLADVLNERATDSAPVAFSPDQVKEQLTLAVEKVRFATVDSTLPAEASPCVTKTRVE